MNSDLPQAITKDRILRLNVHTQPLFMNGRKMIIHQDPEECKRI